MSFSLSQKLRRDEPWGHRYAVAFGVTDEIFGVSASKPGKVSAFYNYGVMSVAIPGWTLGTLLGAISGSILPAFIMIKNKQSCASGSAWSYGCKRIICLGSCIIKSIVRICDHHHYNSGSRTGSMALPGGRRECQGGSS